MNPVAQHDRTPTLSGTRAATAVFMALMVVGAITFTGLALDGGRRLNAIAEAQDLADNAARAASQVINTDELRGGNVVLGSGACGAASSVLAGTGGSITNCAASGDTVTVTVSVTSTNTFLPGSYTVTGQASATARYGITDVGS
ncbi:MAG: hypothetical protein HKN26_11575 [Acidimicrobiales bacterium]|nr:hypothetical protein [Acidimicrobiales bacterium]